MYVTKLVLNFYTQLFHRGDGKLDPVPKCGVGFFFDVSQRRMSKKPYTTLSSTGGTSASIGWLRAAPTSSPPSVGRRPSLVDRRPSKSGGLVALELLF